MPSPLHVTYHTNQKMVLGKWVPYITISENWLDNKRWCNADFGKMETSPWLCASMGKLLRRATKLLRTLREAGEYTIGRVIGWRSVLLEVLTAGWERGQFVYTASRGPWITRACVGSLQWTRLKAWRGCNGEHYIETDALEDKTLVYLLKTCPRRLYA